MRISSIETFQRDDNQAIVRVRTDAGAEGYGQTSAYLAGQSVQVLHESIAPAFIGADPWDLEALIDGLVRQQYKFYGTQFWRALCGVDTAVWDLLGKVTGKPVFKLLGGGVRQEVPVYGSSMSRSIAPAAEADRLVRLREEQGFRAFKIRVGQVMGADTDVYPGRTEEIIRATRAALGPDVTLHADANGGFSVSRAIAVGRRLEEHRFGHFEEPCPFPQIENTARVAAALDIAVAGGEQDSSLEQHHRIIASRSVDIIQPDIGYIGGVSRARRVAYMAEAAGIPCTPHCANRSMLQVFSLHLAAAMPSISQYQEWSIEDVAWTRGVYEPVPTVVDGAVRVTTEPGWGVEIDPGFLASSTARITR